MTDGRHFENGFIAIFQPKIIRFKLNLVRKCRLCSQGRLIAKILQIQNCRRPPYWKSSFGYISTSDYRINAKFCTIKQNHVLTQDTGAKYQISKIPDGGRPPFWKELCRYISAGNHPIRIKFGVQMQIVLSRSVSC